MPTGYTAAIADGIDFNTFAMRCARAMGATILMRDEPLDAEIPSAFAPSTWNEERLREASARMAELEAMTPEQAEQAALAAWQEAEAMRQKRIAEIKELRAKYQAMLGRVDAWVPPTPDHEGLKTFMSQQIVDSLKFDCDLSYYEPKPRPDGATWLAQQKAKTASDIEYHATAGIEERQRTADRNAWIKALRESLR